MGLQWGDLWSALALVLVIEGLMPFLMPAAFRRTMASVAQFPDGQLRTVGLVSMLVGIALLYLVR
ncbi:MAG: DUF2065 domain-containing protein [Halofilum sp. (in: g-proteobacteria)]|nr:DUF2065 domain-containing protein [Halofilum sp. (in: g-proteobacteria)]